MSELCVGFVSIIFMIVYITMKKIDEKFLVDIISDEWVNNGIVTKDVYTYIKYKKKNIILLIINSALFFNHAIKNHCDNTGKNSTEKMDNFIIER